MTKTKSLARMYVWWPGINKNIEKSVQECCHCQEEQPNPHVAPLQLWKWSSRPWVRLHMDFAGPFEGKMILIVIGSHSKWIEAFPTKSSTSATVIELSRTLVAQCGVPEAVVTDNGSCFVSEEFETFLLKNGIKHITSAPYHPSTNGLAERAVQIAKRGLKREEGSMMTRMAKVMMAYRVSPQVQQVNHQLYYFNGMNVWNIVSKSRRLNMMNRLNRLHSHKEKLCTLVTLALEMVTWCHSRNFRSCLIFGKVNRWPSSKMSPRPHKVQVDFS